MASMITAFVPFSGQEFTKSTVQQLKATSLVAKIYLLSTAGSSGAIEGCEALTVPSLTASATMDLISRHSATPYSLLLIHDTAIEIGQFSLDRFVSVASSTSSTLTY